MTSSHTDTDNNNNNNNNNASLSTTTRSSMIFTLVVFIVGMLFGSVFSPLTNSLQQQHKQLQQSQQGQQVETLKTADSMEQVSSEGLSKSSLIFPTFNQFYNHFEKILDHACAFKSPMLKKCSDSSTVMGNKKILLRLEYLNLLANLITGHDGSTLALEATFHSFFAKTKSNLPDVMEAEQKKNLQQQNLSAL